MRKIILSLIAAIISTSLSSKSLASNNSCITLYSEPHQASIQLIQEKVQKRRNYFSSLVNTDLLQYNFYETQQVANAIKYDGDQNIVINASIDALTANFGNTQWTQKQIIDMLNEQTFKLLEDNYSDSHSQKQDGLVPTENLTLKIQSSINKHPVVSFLHRSHYQQENTEIGYCFGRGCYVDLVLFRLGVNQNSVKKIWAVGAMAAPGVIWQFHIGVLVQLPDKSWIVIDNNPGSYKVHSLDSWTRYFKAKNSDGNLRFYITDSSKFTPSTGTYDSVQLGLNLQRSSDWYKGYFQDLMEWF
ncbi:MAG: hypothetical protein KDD45_14180, partial [Bdellovibrionales bacterium]|nr:hypothetical protein [Bdellovibrionales bacterium]